MTERLQFGVKRSFDVCVSMTCLVLLAIPFFFLALWIRHDSAGPAFFRQKRPGKTQKPFTVWKFRTLAWKQDRIGPQPPPQANDSRVTRIGGFLRKSGLDELPQLLNVLCGQMSLVGPRPTLMERLPLFHESHYHRFLMRPGITGWAVIAGRNNLTWNEKAELDCWYVDHFSLWIDALILWKTPGVLLSGTGVYMSVAETIADDTEEGS